MIDNQDIAPIGGSEPTVTFKLESDRDLFEVLNPHNNESMVKISGYDLQFWFNTRHLKSVEDIEMACNGLHQLFRDLIIQQILGEEKQSAKD